MNNKIIQPSFKINNERQYVDEKIRKELIEYWRNEYIKEELKLYKLVEKIISPA